MAKNSIRDYSATSSLNTDVQSVDISEGCAASGINNAIREVMADLKDVSSGTIALESPQADSLTVTGDLTVDTNTLYVDSANNRVGVGTTSPGAALTVEGTKDSLASQLKITATGVVSQYIGGGDNVGLAIGHDHSSLPIIFKTGVAGGTGVTGSGTERVRILGSGGLTFNGDTAAANALDDYEEGTFTPTLIATGGSLSVTYGSANGRYTKIGNVVHIAFQLRVNAHSGGSNEYRVGGLPFNASNPNSDHVGVSTAGLESHPIGSTEQLIQVIDHNSTQVRLLKAQNNTGWGVYTPSSSMSVFMSFTYPVA